MAEESQNHEHFETEAPHIPGVSEPAATNAAGQGLARSKRFKGIGLLVVTVVALGAGMVWWMHRAPLSRATVSPTTTDTQPLSSPEAAAAAGRTTSSDGEVAIATTQELEKPWSAKEFIFRKPITREKVPAIVVRLPTGRPDRVTSYWAFALEAPFEHCALEYVADLGKLASQYHFRASHPMVGNLCSNTVYDPLRLGVIGNGAWARGEAVRGAALRPPMAIEIRIEGNRLLASRME